MFGLNKKQRLAIARMNRALKALDDADIQICGMDTELYYATKEAINNTTNTENYCPVARAAQHGDEGTGRFDASVYQDSGGW